MRQSAEVAEHERTADESQLSPPYSCAGSRRSRAPAWNVVLVSVDVPADDDLATGLRRAASVHQTSLGRRPGVVGRAGGTTGELPGDVVAAEIGDGRAP